MVYLLLAFQVVGFIILAYLLIYLFLTLRRARALNGAEAVKGTVPVEMIAELRAAVDQIAEDLSARSAVLERELEAVDRRGDRLESLMARAAAQQAAPKSETRVTTPPTQPVAPTTQQSYTRSAPEPAPAEPPQSPTGEPPETAPAGGAVGFRPSELRDAQRYQQVFALADEGLSSLEIARRTRVGREEVELLLGLRESSPRS